MNTSCFGVAVEGPERGESKKNGSDRFLRRLVKDDDLAAKITSLFRMLKLAFEELRVRASRNLKIFYTSKRK